MSMRVTRKRARLEAEQAQENAASESTFSPSESPPIADPGDFQRDEEFWFEDGTLILVARGVGFKVYKGPLVDHSPVFKDMLSLPQPTNTEAQSCPIIPLPDPPADLRYVLRILMPSKHIRLTVAHSPSFSAVCACIRIGHKYQIDHLVEESVKCLRKYYPDTLDMLTRSRTRVRISPSCAVTVVNLARLIGAHHILPMALIECCKLGSALVHGIPQPGGTREHLSMADLALCFQAQEKLIEARLHAFAQMFYNLRNVREDVCDELEEDLDHVYAELLDGTLPGLCTPNVWDSIAVRVINRLPTLCKKCRKAILLEEQEQQKDIFERLPELVGVVVERWGKDTSEQK